MARFFVVKEPESADRKAVVTMFESLPEAAESANERSKTNPMDRFLILREVGQVQMPVLKEPEPIVKDIE